MLAIVLDLVPSKRPRGVEKSLPRDFLHDLSNEMSALGQMSLLPGRSGFDSSGLGFLDFEMDVSQSIAFSSEGILQEVRRARTYVAFVETNHQACAFSLFFCHCADDVDGRWLAVVVLSWEVVRMAA
jgi:hypothetical protein